nr:MAG TPA: hypothetical protein [Caudoviricetes sp.]
MVAGMKKNETHYSHCTSVPTPVCRGSVTRLSDALPDGS